MVDETGPQNAAHLRAIAIEGKSTIGPDLDALAAVAKQKMIAPSDTLAPGQNGRGGILMRAVDQAASTLRAGWEGRRGAEWEHELEEYNVSMQEWLEYMTEQLLKINESAEVALDQEHMLHEEFGLRINDIMGNHAAPAIDIHHQD